MFRQLYQRGRSRLRQRYQRWLELRLPRSEAVTLNQRRIFIFPTRVGLALLGFIVLLLLLAINYQNSMAFALVFLLFSVMLVSVLHTYANLSGLTIQVQASENGFVGDALPISLLLSRGNRRQYCDVRLYWPDSTAAMLDLQQRDSNIAVLHYPLQQRGKLQTERLRIETVYPLGLIRAWSRLSLQVDALVYPAPLPSAAMQTSQQDSDEGDQLATVGSDDFYGIQAYRAGDSLKHIAWKHFAREQGLQSKQFASYQQQQLWLDWQSVGGTVEQRLSKLCYWLLQLDRQQLEYGLRLPGVEVAPAQGVQHRQYCLAQLALFPGAQA